MIAKKTRGNRMQGLVGYLFGPGRHEEHLDPRLVASWEPGTWSGRLDHVAIDALVEDLDAPRRLYGTAVAGGDVWQCSLRNAADDRVLTDDEWGQIAQDTISALGFGEHCRWIAVRHAEDHIHLAVSLVREDGRVASVWNDQRKLSTACAQFEQRYGLVMRAQRAGGGMPGLARAEIERAHRGGQPEPARTATARKVRAAAAGARDEADFLNRARSAGLLLRARRAPGDPRTVTGYSVADPAAGTSPPLWFGGGRLAPDLTLPKLRQRWQGTAQATSSQPADRHPDPGAEPTAGAVAEAVSAGRETALAAWARIGDAADPRLPVRLRIEAWAEAGHVVDTARARIASLPAEDTASWSAVAGDTAGVLAALAVRLESSSPGPLSWASDELARSVQHSSAAAGDTPGAPRTGSATQLRPTPGLAGVARIAVDAVLVGRGGQTAVAVLLTELARLVRQIEAAHAAGHRAELARRAHLSAEQLLTHLEAAVPTGRGDTGGDGIGDGIGDGSGDGGIEITAPPRPARNDGRPDAAPAETPDAAATPRPLPRAGPAGPPRTHRRSDSPIRRRDDEPRDR